MTDATTDAAVTPSEAEFLAVSSASSDSDRRLTSQTPARVVTSMTATVTPRPTRGVTTAPHRQYASRAS
ncbi:MAG: hypothetical protein ABEJ28_10810 [Salinigranum sp.]